MYVHCTLSKLMFHLVEYALSPMVKANINRYTNKASVVLYLARGNELHSYKWCQKPFSGMGDERTIFLFVFALVSLIVVEFALFGLVESWVYSFYSM